MDKRKLERRIEKGKTQREIAAEFGVSQSTVRFYLKKYKLETKNKVGPRLTLKEHVCDSCHKPFQRGKSHRHDTGCRELCNYCSVKKTRRKKKDRIVEILGGACVICGYNKCKRVLHAHHLRDKEFAISRDLNLAWHKIEKELTKCVLLCANCHGEVHAGVATVPDKALPL